MKSGVGIHTCKVDRLAIVQWMFHRLEWIQTFVVQNEYWVSTSTQFFDHAFTMNGVLHCSGVIANTQKSCFLCLSKAISLQWMKYWFICDEYCTNWKTWARYITLNGLWCMVKPQLNWFSKHGVYYLASTCSLKCQQKPEEPLHKKWCPMDQYCSLQKYFSCFSKGPQTPCDSFGMMVWGDMVWYEVKWYGIRLHGMVWGDMVLEWVGYGMGFPYHGTMVLVCSSYTTLEWVPLRSPNLKNWTTS